MRYVISGYNDKVKLLDIDKELNITNELVRNINSSSFLATKKDYVFCYDRMFNPYIYILRASDLQIVDKKKVKIDNLTHLVYSNVNKVLYGCSYVGGCLFALKVNDNCFGEVIDIIREENINIVSKCHCLLLNKLEDVLVCANIATDKLNFYHINQNTIEYIKSIQLPIGVGLRHIIYSQSEKYIYIITEYSNEILIVDVSTSLLVFRISTLLLKNNEHLNIKSYGATLFISDCFLYASNRGLETITKFKIIREDQLEYFDSYSVYGNHSRHMIMTKDKKYIISCNKNSNNICFINKDTKELAKEISFENPSCIVELND